MNDQNNKKHQEEANREERLARRAIAKHGENRCREAFHSHDVDGNGGRTIRDEMDFSSVGAADAAINAGRWLVEQEAAEADAQPGNVKKAMLDAFAASGFETWNGFVQECGKDFPGFTPAEDTIRFFIPIEDAPDNLLAEPMQVLVDIIRIVRDDLSTLYVPEHPGALYKHKAHHAQVTRNHKRLDRVLKALGL